MVLGHVGDQDGFDRVLGLELIEKGLLEGGVSGRILAGHDQGAGRQAVQECVFGGFRFSGFGAGAGGFRFGGRCGLRCHVNGVSGIRVQGKLRVGSGWC